MKWDKQQVSLDELDRSSPGSAILYEALKLPLKFNSKDFVVKQAKFLHESTLYVYYTSLEDLVSYDVKPL
jgi:hypothetical protein